MNVSKVLVTGDRNFIDRYQFLFNGLSSSWDQIDSLPTDNFYQNVKLRSLAKQLIKKIPYLSKASANRLVVWNASSYIRKSKSTEQKIRQLPTQPDLVFQVFGTFSPFWDKFDIPYVMYLDYTTAQAQANWQPWAIKSKTELQEWLNCEKRAYQNALHIFTMGGQTKDSLVQNYGVDPSRVTAVGSAGQYLEPFRAEKSFGSRQILFNGSDFERKGGDILVEAFEKVYQQLPDAKLIIVGEKREINHPAIASFDYVSPFSKMRQLFLDSDLVVSPARCEPFSCFLIEAMNYGIPCIVSDCDGMTEIVDHDVNGLVIPQPDSTQLAAQIIELLTNPNRLKQMSENAKLKVQTEFTWHEIARKMTATIEQIDPSRTLVQSR